MPDPVTIVSALKLIDQKKKRKKERGAQFTVLIIQNNSQMYLSVRLWAMQKFY